MPAKVQSLLGVYGLWAIVVCAAVIGLVILCFAEVASRFSETARRHYARLYARRGAMHAGFAQFAAFDQDAADNKAFLAGGKLGVPVLALGGEKSFGTTMAAVMRFAASDVEEGVVPNSGHWIMEENPKATITLVRAFLDKG